MDRSLERVRCQGRDFCLEDLSMAEGKEPSQRKRLKKLGGRPWSEGKLVLEQEEGLEKAE